MSYLFVKNCLQKVSGRVLCMAFDTTGSNVWIGDDHGSISAFHFDILTLKLNKTRRIVSNNGYSITSISIRNMALTTAKHEQGFNGSVLLVNAMPNYLLTYRLVDNKDVNSLRLRKRVAIKQEEHALRSTFCPIANFKKTKSSQACLVCSGSEDFGVYIYDMENDDKSLITRLQGHRAVVKDVAFNYDQSLLASGDTNGTVIIWKTNTSSHS
jgi:hypothetical protein